MKLLSYVKKKLSAVDLYLTFLVVLLFMLPCLKLFPQLINPPSVLWSDYEDILSRYDALAQGAMSLWDFIFIKHGGHNHAVVFLLGLLDIWIDHGQLRLLSWTILFSHFTVFGIYTYLARKAIPDKLFKFLATAFIASQIFCMRGGEIWAVSFQVVVASFRLLLVVGFWMFCRALLKQQDGSRLLIASLVILFVASVSHGSGILIPPLLLALYAFVYAKGQYLPYQKKASIPILLLLAVFILHSRLYPSTMGPYNIGGFFTVLKHVPSLEWTHLPGYIAYMLGYFFAWDLGESIKPLIAMIGPGHFFTWNFGIYLQKVIGMMGILLFLGLGYRALIKKSITSTHLFFLSLGVFSLASALTGIVFNLGQMESREIEQGSLNFLISSRYIFMPNGFWISTIVLLFSELGYFSSQKTYQKIISTVFALIVLFSAGSSVSYSFRESYFWSSYLNNLFRYEKVVATDAWEDIPTVPLNDVFSGLAGHQTFARDRIEVQRKYGLGPYAKASKFYEKQDIAILDISNDRWDHGISKTFTGFIVQGLDKNKETLKVGKKIKFADGSIRTIMKQVRKGSDLEIHVDGSLLSAANGYPQRFNVMTPKDNALNYVLAYPDLWKRAQKLKDKAAFGRQHYIEHGKSEGRSLYLLPVDFDAEMYLSHQPALQQAATQRHLEGDERLFFAAQRCLASLQSAAVPSEVYASKELNKNNILKIEMYPLQQKHPQPLNSISIKFGTNTRKNPGTAALRLKTADGTTRIIPFDLSTLIDNQYRYFSLDGLPYTSGEIISLTGGGIIAWESHMQHGKKLTCLIYDYANGTQRYTPGCAAEA